MSARSQLRRRGPPLGSKMERTFHELLPLGTVQQMVLKGVLAGRVGTAR
jgi:hypothetical protein